MTFEAEMGNTVFPFYSLVSEESITVAFEQTQSRRSVYELSQLLGRNSEVSDITVALTRLKILDSVLWSLRLLTGDFVLSARGVEALKKRCSVSTDGDLEPEPEPLLCHRVTFRQMFNSFYIDTLIFSLYEMRQIFTSEANVEQLF